MQGGKEIMKNTGIVRRIDDLGRLVIPKEFRRTIKVNEGDELEISLRGSEIVVKKYNGNLEDVIKGIAQRHNLSVDEIKKIARELFE